MYVIMNKDTLVATVSCRLVYGEEVFSLVDVCGKLPYSFTDANTWISSRQASKHRKHIAELLKQCGCETLTGYIRMYHCVSIIDTFWMKSSEESVTWKDVSPYINKFDVVLSKLAFEGAGLYGIQMSSTSPEFNIDGMYQKCCVREGNDLYLIKRGSEGCINEGFEPYSEYLTSKLYSIITEGWNVKYDLVNYHGKKASKCKLFTNENYGYVPASLLGVNAGIAGIEYFEKLGCDDIFRAIVVADAVCFNEDRHMGNYGVLVDNTTLVPTFIAPIFDHNRSLLWASWNDYDEYTKTHNTVFGKDWVLNAKQVLTPKLRSILINLKGYEIKFECDNKFTEDRLRNINRKINEQINSILR